MEVRGKGVGGGGDRVGGEEESARLEGFMQGERVARRGVWRWMKEI